MNRMMTFLEPSGGWQLVQGEDGYTRAANIRYRGGKTNRPIAKLYPLEVLSTNNDKYRIVLPIQPPLMLVSHLQTYLHILQGTLPLRLSTT